MTLTARQLTEVSAQLSQYAERYHARLKPANRLCVQQLLQVVRALRSALLPMRAATLEAHLHPSGAASCTAGGDAAHCSTPSSSPTERIVQMNDFLCSLGVDHLNLFRLSAFCEGSQIAKKLRGFADAQSQVARQGGSAVAQASGTLHGVIRVLEALTNDDADGRVLLHVEPALAAAPAPSAVARAAEPRSSTTATTPASDSWLKVLHLNPSVYFSQVLAEAHAVVLAGGTCSPSPISSSSSSTAYQKADCG